LRQALSFSIAVCKAAAGYLSDSSFFLGVVVVADAVFSSDELAGGSPAATHFSCFAKKSKQKKATAKARPLRGSQ